MSQFAPLPIPPLPETTKKSIDEFLEAARSAFRENLRSVVLYGSAAEGTLRPTSDLNVILVLHKFDTAQAECLRPILRLAQSSVQLSPMFLLNEELPAAVRSFAPKFADVLRRRAILFGDDPFATMVISRDAEVRQLRQQLLNLTLRMRAAYTARGAREEQLAAFLVRTAGPLRKLASSLLRLSGHETGSPQAALQALGEELKLRDWGAAVRALEALQSGRIGEPGLAAETFLKVLECVQKARQKAETIGGEARHESI